jgi:hypothetical protein
MLRSYLAARPDARGAQRFRLVSLLAVAGLIASAPLAAANAPPDETTAGTVQTSSAAYEAAIDIAFPTLPSARFTDDYHAPRGGGTRVHRATDLIGEKLWPLYATVGGTICYINGVDTPKPSWGYSLSICGDDGRRYNYIHINDDHPGTADARAPHQYAYAPAIHRGARVERGQLVAWMGDSGNAKGIVPHLHLEIVDERVRDPYGSNRMNPYRSLKAAFDRGDFPDGRVPLVHGCPPGGSWTQMSYSDTSSSAHREAIACVSAWEIAHGKGDGSFAPAEILTRAQMSSFLVRTMERAGVRFPSDDELAARATFSDIGGTEHEATIRRVAHAGIALGYPDGTFRPNEHLTRGQIATFVARTYEHIAGQQLAAPRDAFVDVGSAHRRNVNALAAARMVDARSPGRYAPGRAVPRDQMADLLARFVDRLAAEGRATPPR